MKISNKIDAQIKAERDRHKADFLDPSCKFSVPLILVQQKTDEQIWTMIQISYQFLPEERETLLNNWYLRTRKEVKP